MGVGQARSKTMEIDSVQPKKIGKRHNTVCEVPLKSQIAIAARPATQKR
jgi:hypothetical protein